MKVLHCLTPGNALESAHLGLSNLASVRLRTAVCSKTMEQVGWRVTAGDTVTGAPDLILVGKPGASQIEERGTFWLDQLLEHRVKGAHALLDYTDHHLGFPSPMTDFYRKALDVCHACVTPSPYMAHLLSATWNGPIFQINDPIEVPTRSGPA